MVRTTIFKYTEITFLPWTKYPSHQKRLSYKPRGPHDNHHSTLSVLSAHARILEWDATSFSRGSSQPRIKPQSLHCRGLPHCRQILYCWDTREAPFNSELPGKPVVDYICRNLFLDSPFCSIGHLSPDRRKSSLVDETPGEEIYDNWVSFGSSVFRQVRGNS